VNSNSTKEINDSLPRKSRAEAKNLTGPKIRFFREKRGWTQQQFSDSLRKIGNNITRDVIANIETQRCPVTDCQIVLFARILGVSWKSLFPDKTILDEFAPPACPNRQPEPNSPKAKEKCSARSRTPETSRKDWDICEITCKSLRITFHRPS
jgi:transcriptional regulator with XRE-family HTH domain